MIFIVLSILFIGLFVYWFIAENYLYSPKNIENNYEKHIIVYMEEWAMYVILMLGLVFLCTGFVGMSMDKSSSVRAEIINRKLGTDYTAKEFFYGIDVIEELEGVSLDTNKFIKRK